MKKIIDFIKAHWVALLITLLIVFVGISGIVSRCEIKRSNDASVQIDAQSIRQQIVDSVNSVQAKKDIYRLDSINKSYEKKIIPLKAEIKDLKAKLKNEVGTYNSDTVYQSAPCDSIIKTSQVIIDSLDYEVTLLSSINGNMLLKIDAMDIQLGNAELSLMASYAANSKLQKELTKQTNWWHRNDKWIYMGVGAVLTFLIMK